jgi:hypothetical protein
VREPSLARSRARLTGVIDTLSAGYEVVNRHAWIILIPIVLDLFLWLGPQLSAGRLISQTLSRLAPLGPGGASARLLDQAQQRELVEVAEGFNLLAALAPSMVSVVGVPSLVAMLGIRDPLQSTPVETWGAAAAIFFGALAVGMLLGSLYYAILAQQVRDGAVSLTRLAGDAVRSWLRVVEYLVLLGGLGILFGLPIGFLAVGAALLSPALGSLALSAVMMALVWVGIYLFFVPNAIFLSQVGPLQAVKNSVAVVRINFWGAVGIVLLITLVLLGMGRVWDLAADRIAGPWGLAVGILGNAYIASGLVAASMRFYRERIDVVRGSNQEVSSQQSVTQRVDDD